MEALICNRRHFEVDTAVVEDTFISIDDQDSIFSGSANITKLLVTKDDNNNWLPEYWDVSGELDRLRRFRY